MQKAFIAIALALTLTCAFAGATATNWVKQPSKAVENTDSNFTNTASLKLGGLSTSDVNLISFNASQNTSTNTSDYKWTVYTKAVNTKSLEATTNTTYVFQAPQVASILFGYAITYTTINDTTTNNIPQAFLFQTKLSTAVALPRIQLSTNTNASDWPSVIGFGSSTKNLAFFIKYHDKVNYTSVSFGASTVGKEFTLISGNTVSRVSAAWGEALSTSQFVVSYYAGEPLNVAVVDVTSGNTINAAAVAGKWDKTITSCKSYATDKKYYGVWCTNTTGASPNDTTTVYVSSNSSSDLVVLTSFNTTAAAGDSIIAVQPYAGYLAFFWMNAANSSSIVLSYETWDVSALTTFKNKTTYLTYDQATSGFENYRIPEAGIYGLIYDVANVTIKSNVQVGQIMGASSLSTVFGFIMTIVAGLFLF